MGLLRAGSAQMRVAYWKVLFLQLRRGNSGVHYLFPTLSKAPLAKETMSFFFRRGVCVLGMALFVHNRPAESLFCDLFPALSSAWILVGKLIHRIFL